MEINLKVLPNTQWPGLLREGKAKWNVWGGAIFHHPRTEPHPKWDELEWITWAGSKDIEEQFQHAFKPYTEEGSAFRITNWPLPWDTWFYQKWKCPLSCLSVSEILIVSTVKWMTVGRKRSFHSLLTTLGITHKYMVSLRWLRRREWSLGSVGTRSWGHPRLN